MKSLEGSVLQCLTPWRLWFGSGVLYVAGTFGEVNKKVVMKTLRCPSEAQIFHISQLLHLFLFILCYWYIAHGAQGSKLIRSEKGDWDVKPFRKVHRHTPISFKHQFCGFTFRMRIRRKKTHPKININLLLRMGHLFTSVCYIFGVSTARTP